MTTPAQTIGPFFSHALTHIEPLAPGVEGVWILGTVHDGAGAPVPDALIESWQDADGFTGFGRCPTDAEGKWSLRTVKTPYIAVSVFARGLLHRVVTRIYFPDQVSFNASDPVLSALSDSERATLIAVADGADYRFDIHLQGDHETVFFSF